jgi:hypothetical protein
MAPPGKILFGGGDFDPCPLYSMSGTKSKRLIGNGSRNCYGSSLVLLPMGASALGSFKPRAFSLLEISFYIGYKII